MQTPRPFCWRKQRLAAAKPAVGKVHGTVTYQGQPVTDAEIHLHCLDTGMIAISDVEMIRIERRNAESESSA